MHDQQDDRGIPLGVIASISILVLAAAGGGSWWAWRSQQSSSVTTTTPKSSTPKSSQTIQPTTEKPSTKEKIQVYWLNDVDNQIVLSPSSIPLNNKTLNKGEILESAFNSLLAGPTNGTFTTTIPQGTKLRGVSLKNDGVHVDLSQEFTVGGGSSSMSGRLAQIVYTASSLDPNTQVWIEVDGKQLEVLGGEGLMLDQPLTRQDVNQNFPL
ncbi:MULTISPECIES: GerMN domain-containing protein [Moorena]|uniref:Spore germination protein n=1 Tax=Moorena producens 3L TaxID=489825 RepID=F4Y076_9CYAN|nr:MULTISPECIES: GerMN domain-containing protein [Moorena]NEQ12933.1 spore germination protein [Moorena sp. SIO3E2]NES86450.1 spore germination protein [Moorena sp. SIO2B7]EGJ29808.1 spore germination protein [Moorena producens 3L]NEP34109.1 spore germination protein [Moorena sp. SIO3B2]NEP69753.1 spore germination protein [Moorena sp. SIO3A5]